MYIYWRSSLLTSALVPSPPGRRDEASLTSDRIVTTDGRSDFSRKCSLAFETATPCLGIPYK